MAKHLILLIAVICFWTPSSNASPNCAAGNVRMSHLNGAMYMIAKAEYDFAGKPRDCSDIFHMGNIHSGIYTIWPTSRLLGNKSVGVYCDMYTDGGGWTVIQRRGGFGNPKDFFNKDWKSYKNGFGDLKKEFWLGNDNISALTNQRVYAARFELGDDKGREAYAKYDTFWIDDENSKFRLHVDGYTGDAGDSLAVYHNTMSFSTPDQDNDRSKSNCGELFSGGWWYRDCAISNLNAPYVVGRQTKTERMKWPTFSAHGDTLAYSAIMIRPRGFKLR